mmetsp:Transcript_35486/g.41061  ORF Transcript_35486/g.41061 Transcript_35486/m.41061 type:complete len:145 (+) Transcript_35486:1605-2039(+)
MDLINNVFVAGGGQDVISLSVYNNAGSYKAGKFTQSASTLPNSKLRPQSAPFKFADGGFAFNKSIRRDKREELAEIESLKARLTKDDIPFKVETIRKAFEMPAENEFKREEGKKYPYPDAYLMKDPFPKKKKKKKKGKKGKKKK